ncbi:hypothetical protein [Nocardiopsis sp. ATB16-24]|uniref:hypothetical protein n=1 Tax=Nocardiopsis sp. ATB16-24 TaxID=3019555 RepID=UPI0033248DDC
MNGAHTGPWRRPMAPREVPTSREPPSVTRGKGAYFFGVSVDRYWVWVHTPTNRAAPTAINATAHDPTGAMDVSHPPTTMLGGASP